MAIEFDICFCLSRIFEFALMLWLAMGKPICGGALFVLSAFGLLAGRSKINEFSHSSLDGNRILA